MTNKQTEQVKGVVKNITYHNEENGYIVAKILPEGKHKVVAVVGYVTMLYEGETAIFRGEWIIDPKYGRQLKFDSYETVVPSSVEGIKQFLSSKYIEGVGEKFAEKIVNMFGEETLSILDENPRRLKKVPGLGKKKLEAIIEGWNSHRHIRTIMIFLHTHGISEAYASKIYDKYKDNTIDELRSDPYKLIKDIRGIGFIKADQIAAKLGIGRESNERVRAGIQYSLDTLVEKGHVFVPRQLLIEETAEMLELDADAIMEGVKFLIDGGWLVSDDERVYRSDIYRMEVLVAQHLHLLASTPMHGLIPDRSKVEGMIGDIEHSRNIDFAPQQREAIVSTALANCMVLTGGPGTGKTTTVLGMIDVLRHLKFGVLLCAPTGRAAKRLSEATGLEAKTIHRLLEYDPFRGKFARNESNPLDAHAIIMDEASMVDTILFADFLKAVSPATKLIIVGDVNQLPSIGPGNVLRDIISSGSVPTIRLTEIFRQAASSKIVQSAHLINSGKRPYTDNDHNGNFFFVYKNNPEEVASTIVDMVSRRLPSRYGFDPMDDIQVLSPMHKSETGVANLNTLLQERLNPMRPNMASVRRGWFEFRRGDKVMQVRNNYDKMVFNGDIGRVERIDAINSTVRVRFESVVEYTLAEIDDLVPAYAISVHKSQGSEFRSVVIPVTTQHFIMLKRNLIYTAVTRARELVVIVGDTKALEIAVRNDQISERYTSLAERLADLAR
ncbi:ATP-dependent RecD-like DNA helicase [Candidatus Latescibacterota bacterium]